MKISVNKSYVNRGNLIFTGIALIVIGLITLYRNVKFLSIIINIISLAFIIKGVSQLISRVVNNNDKINGNATIGHAVTNLGLGLGIELLPGISLSILPMAFAIYLILNGIVEMITMYLYTKSKTKLKIDRILRCITYFALGLAYLFAPLIYVNEILVIIAVYFILFGVDLIRDFISEVTPQKTKNKFKRRVRITLPVFLSASIPHKVLKGINEYFEVNEEDDKEINEKSEEDVDLEVFIHVTEDGVGMIGHVDIYYNGEIISYGNYDESSYKLFGIIGRGVLFSCEKDKYIKFCTGHAKKTLFSYGLKLNDEQKGNVEHRINDIKSNLIEWKTPVVFEKNEDKSKEYNDYASVLYRSTGAKFYKFKSGRFKTYFGFNTNCVLLADSVIGKSGTDILSISGVITPGAYYEYLKNEFAKRNSIVISKNIYR